MTVEEGSLWPEISRAKSSGFRARALGHGSEDRFSSSRIARTETSAAGAANKAARTETEKRVWKRLLAGAKRARRRTPRFQTGWTCGSKEITPYFLRSARVRWSLMAVVRRVSGTFLLVVRRLRSTALSMGSMCMVTSRGALGLLIRLRTTV